MRTPEELKSLLDLLIHKYNSKENVLDMLNEFKIYGSVTLSEEEIDWMINYVLQGS